MVAGANEADIGVEESKSYVEGNPQIEWAFSWIVFNAVIWASIIFALVFCFIGYYKTAVFIGCIALLAIYHQLDRNQRHILTMLNELKYNS